MNTSEILIKLEAIKTERFKNTINIIQLDAKIEKLNIQLIKSVKKKQ